MRTNSALNPVRTNNTAAPVVTVARPRLVPSDLAIVKKYDRIFKLLADK